MRLLGAAPETAAVLAVFRHLHATGRLTSRPQSASPVEADRRDARICQAVGVGNHPRKRPFAEESLLERRPPYRGVAAASSRLARKMAALHWSTVMLLLRDT